METRVADEGWDSAAGRIRWLLAHSYGGRRSAMAKATGVSLTGLIKVLTGQQTPGRRLMETIVQNTDVSPAWLLTGTGPPFTGSAIPVADECLLRPPSRTDAKPAEGVPALADLYSPSRYWLRLGAGEPAVRAKGSRLQAGDLLLMEGDRAAFPAVDRLDRRWGVVRSGDGEGAVARLAELTYSPADDDTPAVLEAETFVRHPQEVQRLIADQYPDGSWKVVTRSVLLEPPVSGGAGKRGRRRWQTVILPRQIDYEDVLAICVLLVRQPDG